MLDFFSHPSVASVQKTRPHVDSKMKPGKEREEERGVYFKTLSDIINLIKFIYTEYSL